MFQKFRTIHLLLWLFLLPLLASSPIHGADATSFDPTRVEVKAKGSGGVPVGTIVAWPVATNPEDMDNWLECNGQSISPSVWPELFAVVGAQVPDLRGLFLRGYGSQVYAQVNGTTVGVTSTLHESGQLGQVQGDAIRDIQGDAIGFANSSGYAFSTSGAFDVLQGTYIGIYSVDFDNQGLRFDAARVVPTAAENRPANQAVRYLMRARP